MLVKKIQRGLPQDILLRLRLEEKAICTGRRLNIYIYHMMNNWQSFLFLVCIPIIFSFEISEETRNLLEDACNKANEDIQKNGRLNEPQITIPQHPSYSSSIPSPSSAYFILPYILFDPINQFSFLFNDESSKLLCPLCSRLMAKNSRQFFS